MNKELPFVDYGTKEYQEAFLRFKKYNLEKNLSRRLELKTSYFLALLEPNKITREPALVKLPRTKYQIDVIAEFGNILILAECKSGASHNVSSDIDKISANREELKQYFNKLTKTNKAVLFLLVYSQNKITENDFRKAKKNKIDIWDEKIFSDYLSIAKQLKDRAQQLVFSDLLAQKGIKWGHKQKFYNCLVTKGTYKGHDCFNFQMSPAELLKIAYVHRRNLYNSIGNGNSDVPYQRMISIKKIKDIQEYLEIPGNSFPTPILINFDKKLEFNPLPERNSEKRTGNVSPGWLRFPEEYGYAWIIDGQHRLFGYSGLGEITHKHMLNIIAFYGLNQVEQANLFVDINQNQKSIPADYLWDLYTDIYPTEDQRNKFSWLVKELNKKSRFFMDQIYIPSIATRPSKSYNLKINNIGVSLKNKTSQVYKNLLDENIQDYYKILDLYFSLIISRDSLMNDWKRGHEGFLCSNNGVAILCYVLNYFHRYLLLQHMDIKNATIEEICEKLKQYTNTIAITIEKMDLDYLNEQKKSSSESGRKDVAKNIIIKAGELDRLFKELSGETYLNSVKEDKYNELKETFAFNIKENRMDNELFKEAILGTICAFINAGIDGNLYVGVRDNQKIVGIDEELNNFFDGNFDKLKLTFENHLDQSLRTKFYPKDSITIEEYIEDPLVLKINVPQSEEGVAVVRIGQKLKSWYRVDAKKIQLTDIKSDEDLSLYLKNRKNAYDALMREEYTKIQEESKPS